MKLKSALLAGLMALAAGPATAADIVFDITGATAFRAAANASIIALLGGSGTTEYAFIGTSGIGGTNRAIFKGSMAAFPGDVVYVRASWSGSTQGIKDLADQVTTVQFLTLANPVSTTGVNLGVSPNPAPIYETTKARWAFSDVDKLQSERPNVTFLGGPVGVVPFMFIAGQGAPAAMNNMTDQLHEALWSTGLLPLSMFTGNAADSARTVLSTGRNNGSGTRALILSETQYGSFTPVFQWEHDPATFNGTRVDGGAITAVKRSDKPAPHTPTSPEQPLGNFGYSSNSGVRDMLTRPATAVTVPGATGPQDVVICSYLTISDAVAATGYIEATGAILAGGEVLNTKEGANPMTYNGVRYSVANVQNGSYSLWGYQQFYLAPDATTAEQTFDAAFRAAIPANMGSAGIAIPTLAIRRADIDGGLVSPLQ